MTTEAHRTQMARAATVVMAAFVVSRVLGLGREVFIGSQFGTSRELDAYLAAFRIPDLIFQLVAGGALGSAFIPTFTGYLVNGRNKEAWRLASSIVNLVLIVLTVCAAVAACFAPWLVSHVVAPGFTPEQQMLTVRLMRLMLISPIVFGVSGVAMSILNSYQHFLLPALAPSVYNICIIAGAALLSPFMGVFGLAWGVVAGSFLHLGIQMPQLIRKGLSYRPVIDVFHPGVQEVGRLMLPRVLGLATVQINFLVNTFLASGLAGGSLAALNYAWMLMLLPQGVFAMGIATAAFPTFSQLAAEGQRHELRQILSQTVCLILYLAIPSSVALILLGEPLTQLLLQRGRFDVSSTAAVVWPLQFYSLGLIGHSVLEIVTRAFYSLHDTRTPVAIGVAAMAVNIILSLLLIGPLLHGGLALANSLATLGEMAVLLVIIRRRLGGLEGGTILGSAARTVAASAVMAVGVILFTQWTVGTHTVIRAGGSVLVGCALFLLGSLALRSQELRALRTVLGR
jgi:putative peptidoglycan lipid II flippase